MTEKFCGACSKFVAEETPENIRQVGRNIFWNEDGTPKEVSQLGLLLGLALSSDYGHRHCSYDGAGMSSQDCKVPDEFTPRESES
ncbi:hypothetical protein JXA63_00195 [Candidatus Woesebacteria bacterium]|nr:hypothetical protein [Candidatus Woesebacteria bacterium]